MTSIGSSGLILAAQVDGSRIAKLVAVCSLGQVAGGRVPQQGDSYKEKQETQKRKAKKGKRKIKPEKKKRQRKNGNKHKKILTAAGFEPAIPGLEVRCLIH